MKPLGRTAGNSCGSAFVVGAVAVFDGPSIAMLVAPVVGLLFFVFAGSGGDGGDEHYGLPRQDSDRYQ